MNNESDNNNQIFSKGYSGFTLVEVLIVVVIVAVLGAISYPSYMEQVRKTARKEAIGRIFEIAARLEQYRTQKFTYPVDASVLDDFDPDPAYEKKYDFEVKSVDGGQGFSIEATPQPGTSQAKDLCGSMTFDHVGAWTFSTGKQEDDCL